MSHHDVDPIETLRAELSRVEVSPDFAQHVRRQIGEDALASIGAELSELSVSPAFAVRVRQQIDDAPARPRWFGTFNWRWAAPLGAAALIAAIVLTRDVAPTTTAGAPAGVQVRIPEPAVPQAPQAPAGPSIGLGPQKLQPSHDAVARLTGRTAPSAVASGQQADEMLEVITNQPALIRKLWAHLDSRSELIESVESVGVGAQEIVVPPIEVRPIVVKSLIDPDVTAPGSAPIIRRVTAQQAERSPK